MTNAETISKLNEALSTLIKAYEEPIQDNKLNINKSIREFSNNIILECIKEVDEDKEVKLYKKDNLVKSIIV